MPRARAPGRSWRATPETTARELVHRHSRGHDRGRARVGPASAHQAAGTGAGPPARADQPGRSARSAGRARRRARARRHHPRALRSRARGELERRVLEEAGAAPCTARQRAGRPLGGRHRRRRDTACGGGALLPDREPRSHGARDGRSTRRPRRIRRHGAAGRADGRRGWRRACEAKPDDAEGWYMLGRSYYVMGRFAECGEGLSSGRSSCRWRTRASMRITPMRSR